MFERLHHQRIALVLEALNGHLLRENHCLFGGGTVGSLDLDGRASHHLLAHGRRERGLCPR